MAIQFCPVCKKLLQIREHDGKSIGVCSCGFKRPLGYELSSVEKSKKTKKGEGVISDIHKKTSGGVKHICKKCGYDEAEVIDLGAQLTDESNIYLFKCLKCGHAERQSDGSCNL